MIKILSAIVLISASLCAQSFDEFLNNATENSPYLKSSTLSIEQKREEGSALRRYENPSLELQYSEFKPDIGDSTNGFKTALKQPVRLWGVANDKKNFSDAIIQKAQSSHTLTKAEFIRDLSLFFTNYKELKEFYRLGKEEVEVAKRIYIVSQERYKAGTISQGIMLQAEVDFEMVEIKIQSRNLDSQKLYYQLLELAGLSKEIELDHNYEFSLKENSSIYKNPNLLLIESLKKEALSSAKVNSNRVEWIDLNMEYEKESAQNIFRVGLSIPLTIFNSSSQEREISKLEAKKAQLSIDGEVSKITLENIRLKKERNLLFELQSKNSKTLKTQEKLLEMFEDAYKIANVNLLELQNIKNRVIQTKEALIKIQIAIDQNTITTNYIAGAYNE